MRISGLYVGLMLAAGLCMPVVADDAFDFGRFSDEATGGIQTRSVQTTTYASAGGSAASADKAAMQGLSDILRKNSGAAAQSGLLKGNVNYATDGVEGIGSTPKSNLGSEISRNPYEQNKANTTYSGNDDAKNAALEKSDALANKAKEQEAAAAEKERTAAQKRAEQCKNASTQAEAKSIGNDKEAMTAELESAGLPTNEQCLSAGKAAMDACAKGDVAGTMKAWENAATECKRPIQVDTPAPVGTAGTPDAAGVVDGVVSPIEKAKEALQGLLKLDANGQANPFQQMMMSMLAQKVQEMMGGGSGGGSGNDEPVYGTPVAPTPICDVVTKTDIRTIETYLNAKTGEKIVLENKDDDKDGVTDVIGTLEKAEAKAAAIKDAIKVVTVLTSDLCKNGNLRLKTEETKTYPNGKVETTTSEDIITD